MRWITLLLALMGTPALASPPGMPDTDAVATVALLPGWRAADGTHMAALKIDLAPGWKTYWRAPGETGLAPRFDWSGSSNITAVTALWPRPHLLEAAGLQTIGFKDRLVLPLELTPVDPSAPVVLQGSLSFGVCRDVCVPVDVDVAATLQAVSAPPDPAIVIARADRPLTAREAGVAQVVCRIAPGENERLQLEATIALPDTNPPRRVAVVETGSPGLWASDAHMTQSGDVAQITAVLGPTRKGGGTPWIDRDALRITLIGDHDAVDIRGCPPPQE